MVYNLMTCAGFATNLKCSMAWLGMAIVFFLGAFLGGPMLGLADNFNKWYGIGLGIALYVILVTLTGAARWGIVGGIAGLGIGGFLLTQWVGTTGE